MLLAGAPGCKSMTDAQAARRAGLEAKQTQARDAAAMSGEEVALLDAQALEIKRKAEAARIRQERDQQFRDAVGLLAERKARESLDILDRLLEEGAPIASADPSQPPQPPPPIEPAERARIQAVRGSAYYELGDTPAAIAAFQEAVKLDPSARQARVNLGKLCFMEERFADALAAWRMELADGYRSGKLLFLIAQALYELGRAGGGTLELEAARAAVQEALVEIPDDPELVRWLAVLEFETGRYEEAERLFGQILRATPLDILYLELLANCHIKRGDYEQAVDQLEIAARIAEPSSSLCLTLGDLNAAVRLPERAADWYLRSFGGDPEKAKSEDRYRVGSLLAEAGRAEEAERWLSTIRPDDREYGRALEDLGALYVESGKTDDAVTTLERAAALRPQDGSLHLMLGDLSLDRKDYERAQDSYAKAAGLVDSKADGLAGLGEVAYASGNLAHAVAMYKLAAKERPDERQFAVALAQIEGELRLKEEATNAASP